MAFLPVLLVTEPDAQVLEPALVESLPEAEQLEQWVNKRLLRLGCKEKLDWIR